MMIRGSATMLFIIGTLMAIFVFFMNVSKTDMMVFVLTGIICMWGGIIILLFVFSTSNTGILYDTIPMGTAPIAYIRRDSNIIPLLGKRIFVGESFLDVPRLGLIEDLGKDTVFTWGRKKLRFGLENISYTPDPRYWNMTKELYRLGFDDTDDLYNILNIPDIKDKQLKAHYLERMANIYWMMTHDQPRSTERLLTIFKKKRDKNIVFGKKRKQDDKEDIAIETETPKREQVETTKYRDMSELDKRLEKKP